MQELASSCSGGLANNSWGDDILCRCRLRRIPASAGVEGKDVRDNFKPGEVHTPKQVVMDRVNQNKYVGRQGRSSCAWLESQRKLEESTDQACRSAGSRADEQQEPPVRRGLRGCETWQVLLDTERSQQRRARSHFPREHSDTGWEDC